MKPLYCYSVEIVVLTTSHHLIHVIGVVVLQFQIVEPMRQWGWGAVYGQEEETVHYSSQTVVGVGQLDGYIGGVNSMMLTEQWLRHLVTYDTNSY